ncbi:MAG TPA: hypothetical protein VK473_12750 [Terriglobales bacterium]|nr:hypothetical protein [Terriglobales bacterium]
MKTLTRLLISLLMAGVLNPAKAVAQASADAGGDLNSEIESLRADLRADKLAIITEAMRFTPPESDAFWPIYKKYDLERSRLDDERVQLIKSYSDKFSGLTDADAKSMAEKSFDLESRRIDLKKKYFKEFNRRLPATTVAKFFQLEHRLDLLVDLKLASLLPSLLVKSSAGGQGQ